MLDIALIRSRPDWVKAQIAKLGDESALARIDRIVALDADRRGTRTQCETAQAARNKLNRAMGKLRGNRAMPPAKKAAQANAAASALARSDYAEATALLNGAKTALVNADADDADAQAAFAGLIRQLKAMGDRIDAGYARAKVIEANLQEEMLWLPNLPHASVPVFPSEDDNIPGALVGELREFDFAPKPHWELGPALGIIDFERGVKLSGSRYYVLTGWGARLQRALISFFLDAARANGYEELYLPYVVHGQMLYGSAQFPKFHDTVYPVADGDKYLLPTSEVAITNLHRDEILDEAQLPLRYVAHTPCFRSEKASAGRDVRGIKRVHQFEKVEMYQLTAPDDSYAALEAMTRQAESLCAALEIPHRRLEIVSGDLGFSATKKYDIEMWSPGCGEWLEVSSCSNTEDFQARRAGLRYYPRGSHKTSYLHTLNGSGLAAPRSLIALLENNQQADGSVVIPTALRPYLDGADTIHPK
ncbi:MAG: serine--tRNA ligase [Chloroflexi bacterium]|nr:serine--tRNA ligase [Chloroflexota bacterium]MCY4247144.1 serine--tRNA ligase [Chloroflexota bacterium]